jgi:HSP20 family molecular chaperone IbpA
MNTELKHDEPNVQKQESTTPEGAERTKSRKIYVPAVDILDTNQALLLIAEMPGVDENGVDITIEKNILTIRGVVTDHTPGGYKVRLEEYGIGDYERSFTLPNEIDRDHVQAIIKQGVLKLTFPKIKANATRKVAVAAG